MRALRDLPWLVLALLSKKRTIGGVQIRVASAQDQAERIFHKVEAALRLVDTYAPELYDRLCSDVRYIQFSEASGGHYIVGTATCRIGIDFAMRVNDLELAMMIVHEATHARIAKEGLKYSPDHREEIERRCVDAEITFAARIPDSQHAVQKVRDLLRTKWWETSTSDTQMASELTGRGIPEWLVKRLVSRR